MRVLEKDTNQRANLDFSKQEEASPAEKNEKDLPLKVVMIVAFKDFRDEEYFVTKEVLENNGVEVYTASSQRGVAIGAEGGEAEVDLLVSEVVPNINIFDAVIFAGGPGTLKYLDNETSYNLIKETIAEKDMVLAAICISPVILAKTGVLEGKEATVFATGNKSSVNTLEENGAEFVDDKVAKDGNIITANGPEAAKDFGKEILRAISS